MDVKLTARATAIYLRAECHLGSDEGEQLLRELMLVEPGVQVWVDVRVVDRFEDHVIARLAQALQARNPAGAFIGLPSHHVRLLEYLGMLCDASGGDVDRG